MKNDNYNNMIENLSRVVLKASKDMAKIVEGINLEAPLEALKTFAEFLQNIPDDIKDTIFFGKVQDLKNINLRYEDVVWIVEDFGLIYTEEKWQGMLKSEHNKSDLHQYIAKTILSTSMEKREKLIILLAHIEPLIYKTLEISKARNMKLKFAVNKISVDDNGGMSAESIGKIYVLAVMYIIFANTDAYTDEIDKRIPFRNNILHNGIVMYSDEDIDVAYELLLGLIEILITVEEQLQEQYCIDEM